MQWKLLLAVTLGLFCGSERVRAAAAAMTTDPTPALSAGLVARVHFVGSDQMSAAPNATNLNAIAALPETAALREYVFSKLATAPYRRYQTRVAGSNDCADLVRPLLEDLLRSESFLEARSSTNGFPETILAVRLDEARAALWQSNLAAMLTTWTGIPTTGIKSGTFTGWELKKHDSPSLLRFFRAGGWVVLGLGDRDLSLAPGVLQRIADKQRPVDPANDYWLDAAVDWSALVGKPLVPGTTPLSKVRLVVQARKDDSGDTMVRQQMTAQFARPLGLDLKPWHIPTNLIHNPLTSFGAARGLTAALANCPLVKTLNAAPVPDELFTWANDGVQADVSWAALVNDGNSASYLDRIGPGVVSWFNSLTTAHQFRTTASWAEHAIATSGLLLISPSVHAAHGPTGDYVVGGVVPAPPRPAPLPPALINEIESRPNLVYYDWELTGARLYQTRPLVQIYSIAAGEIVEGAGTVPAKWLEAVRLKLGNCGTVVTLTGPAELTLIRNSTIGLTALETTVLGYWLESPGFPLNNEHERQMSPFIHPPTH